MSIVIIEIVIDYTIYWHNVKVIPGINLLHSYTKSFNKTFLRYGNP